MQSALIICVLYNLKLDWPKAINYTKYRYSVSPFNVKAKEYVGYSGLQISESFEYVVGLTLYVCMQCNICTVVQFCYNNL